MVGDRNRISRPIRHCQGLIVERRITLFPAKRSQPNCLCVPEAFKRDKAEAFQLQHSQVIGDRLPNWHTLGSQHLQQTPSLWRQQVHSLALSFLPALRVFSKPAALTGVEWATMQSFLTMMVMNFAFPAATHTVSTASALSPAWSR